MLDDYAWHDVVGMLGVLSVLGAFSLLQLGKISSSAALYSFLNAFGALLIIISLFYNFNLSAFILEVAWLFMSGIGLFRSSRTH